jgi:hypothetical protein
MSRIALIGPVMNRGGHSRERFRQRAVKLIHPVEVSLETPRC